jgi:hypothetical protein
MNLELSEQPYLLVAFSPLETHKSLQESQQETIYESFKGNRKITPSGLAMASKHTFGMVTSTLLSLPF